MKALLYFELHREIEMLSRRGFLGGLIAAVAAPAIIRPGILMPIKPSLVPAAVEPVARTYSRYVVEAVETHFLSDPEPTCRIECSEVIVFGDRILEPVKQIEWDDITSVNFWWRTDVRPLYALGQTEPVMCGHGITRREVGFTASRDHGLRPGDIVDVETVLTIGGFSMRDVEAGVGIEPT